jgi:hypothetical protein
MILSNKTSVSSSFTKNNRRSIRLTRVFPQTYVPIDIQYVKQQPSKVEMFETQSAPALVDDMNTMQTRIQIVGELSCIVLQIAVAVVLISNVGKVKV